MKLVFSLWSRTEVLKIMSQGLIYFDVNLKKRYKYLLVYCL